MSDINAIDTSVIYDDTDLQLMDNTSAILLNLAKAYNNPEMLDGMSIDKTDSVLRIIDSIEKTVNKRASNKLRLMAIQDTNDDRERLLDILTNLDLRKANNVIRKGNIELDEAEIIDANVSITRGELDTGIEQLSLELLDLEKDNGGDY